MCNYYYYYYFNDINVNVLIAKKLHVFSFLNCKILINRLFITIIFLKHDTIPIIYCVFTRGILEMLSI